MLGTATTSDTGHTVGGLTNGTRHWVRVAARNAAGDGAWSTTRSAVPLHQTRPRPPSTASPSTTGASAWDWTQGPDGGSAVTGYHVQYRTSDTGSGAGTWQDRAHSGTSTAATITALVNGQPYDVEVAAANINGTGAWSATASATPATVPGSPTVTSVRRGRGQQPGLGPDPGALDSPPPDDGGSTITGYHVQYRPGGSGSGGWQTWPPHRNLHHHRHHRPDRRPHPRRARRRHQPPPAPAHRPPHTPPPPPPSPTPPRSASPPATTPSPPPGPRPADGGSPVTGYETRMDHHRPQQASSRPTGQATAAADAVRPHHRRPHQRRAALGAGQSRQTPTATAPGAPPGRPPPSTTSSPR